MRTLIIILGGFALWALCLFIARFTTDFGKVSTTIATVVFVVIWFAAAAANMWIGVTQAGYSFQEELPIFLVIFLLPSAAAIAVKWMIL